MNIARLAFWAVAVLLLAACQPVTREGAAAAGGVTGGETGAVAANALADTSWILATLNGEAVPAKPVVALNLSGPGQATGTDGCNRYSTSYTVEGDAISFDPNAIGTMMACPEPVMAQAQAYLTALTSAATFALAGDTLTLLDADGTAVAVFVAVSSDLAGTSWTADMVNNGNQAVVSVIEGTTLTAEFSADGRLSGSGGCNNFSTTWESDGVSQITIAPPASTLMACLDPQGVMDQEMQYLAALATAATYTIEGNRLELRTADGALAASFQNGVAQAAAGDTGATIHNSAGNLLFVSKEIIPVITEGNPTENIEILVSPAQ